MSGQSNCVDAKNSRRWKRLTREELLLSKTYRSVLAPLLVVEQSSLENRPREGVIYTVVYGGNRKAWWAREQDMP